ncbi:MAG: flagellar filament capping protein FliD [Oscillospiraceae bacterium]|jgi:flagellar capping protein FliD|nr:flagellar filament capping protein FliD [Oscillospiraceae bacterium]
MSSIKGSSLRIGGLNSGLDTEAIVNAMTASTKLRITTNQRKVLRLQEQQGAYRSIIDKFNNFKNKYFDMLNGDTYLRSRSTFNRHKATVSQGGFETGPAGVRVTTGANATAGNYKVTVNSVASPASVTSNPTDISSSGGFNPAQFNIDGKTYAMTITVGGDSKVITFEGNANEAEVVKSINSSLIKAFGSTNDTYVQYNADGDEIEGTGRGLVFFDNRVSSPTNNRFVSADSRAVSTSPAVNLENIVNFGDIATWKTGNNSITFVIDGETRTVNFQTVAMNYFENITFSMNADKTWSVTGGTAEERDNFNTIVREMYDKERKAAYDDWMKSDNRNDNFRTVTLTTAERIAAIRAAGITIADSATDEIINALTSNDNTNIAQRDAARNALTNKLNEKNLDIRLNGVPGVPGPPSLSGAQGLKAWAEEKGIATTDATWATAASVNAFIAANANAGAREIADMATFTYIFNNQMTAMQRDLFNEEVERRDAATRQIEFDRAMRFAYEEFDKWQRANPNIGGSRIDNSIPPFNPALPESADNPRQINNPNYMFWDDSFREMLGMTLTVAEMEEEYGDDWWKNPAAMKGRIDITKLPIHDTLSDLEKEAFKLRLEGFIDEFARRAQLAEDGKIDPLSFLQGGYNEQQAFYNSYADKDSTVITGSRSFNQFLETEVMGISPTFAFTPAEKLAALIDAGIVTAGQITDVTEKGINDFLATQTASDASRLSQELLRLRTARVEALPGVLTGNDVAESLGKGLTVYERILALNNAGFNTSLGDSPLGANPTHTDVTDYINSLETDKPLNPSNAVPAPLSPRERAEAALTNARNAKIANFVLSDTDREAALNAALKHTALTSADKIAALDAAGIEHTFDSDSTDAQINAFTAALTVEDTAKWKTAENNARMAKTSTLTDGQRGHNAINAALNLKITEAGSAPGAISITREDIARYFNESVVNNRLGNVHFSNGMRIEASIGPATIPNPYYDPDGPDDDTNPQTIANPDYGVVTFRTYTLSPLTGADDTRTYNQRKIYSDADTLGVFINKGSTNDFNVGDVIRPVNETTANTISRTTRLSELGLEATNGRYNMTINGVNFSFDGNTTIAQMMTIVNTNTVAGVEMTFSTLTNTFEIKTKEFGTGADIVLTDGAEGLLDKLGFTGVVVQAGKNMSLTINDSVIETNSNTYEVNGVRIEIGPNVEVGTQFDIEVSRDVSQVADIVKQFVKDYNDLIDYVFGYVNEKPDSQYFFLTDNDREELNLSEAQERRWEDRARQGLLYNDRTLINLMGRMRTSLFSGIDRGDGTMFGLFSMGITTSDNWRQNGKLVINESRLTAALNDDIDMITELFTNTSNGLMPQMQEIIDSAIKTTGARHEKGVLIQRAGMASGTSVNDNAIHDQIKRLNDVISNLELRYQKQQDRFWKVFSAMEKQMGQLNSQTDFIGQMAASSMWDTRRN